MNLTDAPIPQTRTLQGEVVIRTKSGFPDKRLFAANRQQLLSTSAAFLGSSLSQDIMTGSKRVLSAHATPRRAWRVSW